MLIMVTIIDSKRFRIKTLLKEAAENNDEIVIEDPSIFSPRVFTASEMLPGERIVVTNHPKRSYFATIEKRIDGKILVH